jgi:hypothetical protein
MNDFFDPSDYESCDENVPDYAELDGIDRIMAEEDFSNALMDDGIEINDDFDDIPY